MKFGNHPTDYYVLTLQDKIIEWIFYTLDSDKYENAAEIHSLYILKEYQGNGYAKCYMIMQLKTL